MQVFINERDIGSVSPAGLLVGEVIEALGVHVDPAEVICEVELDGERFSAADDSFLRRSAANVDRLALRTMTGRDLGLGLRTEVVDALAVVSAKVERAVELFLRGETGPAQALLAQLLEELHLSMLLDAQTAELCGARPVTDARELESVATRLLHAQERGAAGEIRSLLEADLGPLLARWRQRIGTAAA